VTVAATRCVARSAFFLLVLMASFPANGRHLDIPTTDALVEQAPIICNGRVIEILNTLEKGTAVLPHYEKNFSIPVEYWNAKIKVLSTFKGKVPDEIELRFPEIDQHPSWRGLMPIKNGPCQISLQLNKRYRFYLKPGPGQKWYVSVLDGDFDDAFSVQPLEDKEPDDSPSFLKDEAIKLATDYVKKFKPSAKVSEWSIEPRLWASGWIVEFWWPPVFIHDFDPSAEIKIDGNRDINPQSWNSVVSRLSVKDLKAANIGQEYRVYFNSDLQDRFYNTSTLRGHLKSVTGRDVELNDVQDSDWEPHRWPTLEVPVDDIREFQLLVPTPTQ